MTSNLLKLRNRILQRLVLDDDFLQFMVRKRQGAGAGENPLPEGRGFKQRRFVPRSCVLGTTSPCLKAGATKPDGRDTSFPPARTALPPPMGKTRRMVSIRKRGEKGIRYNLGRGGYKTKDGIRINSDSIEPPTFLEK